MAEAELIEIVARYGPWGVSAILLLMNFFVIKRLFETLEKHDSLFTANLTANTGSIKDIQAVVMMCKEEMYAVKESVVDLRNEIRRRRCLTEKE